MKPPCEFRASSAAAALALLFLASSSHAACAQAGGSGLPAIAPTRLSETGLPSPLAATATAGDVAGAPRHRPQVSCDGGQLTVHADNSSLNGILRAIAHCTGMRITGGVVDQRVFGNYGPAAPATVLATLLDGTGINMLLQETASAQPEELILTMRTGGPTPPGPMAVPDDEAENNPQPENNGSGGAGGNGFAQPAGTALAPRQAGSQQLRPLGNPNQTPVPQANAGSAVTSPVPIPQPINNVNGSPNNVSPTAATYPTTNSVPIDSLPTPSTTPSSSGIVDAPNPPAPGSDTANLLQGVNSNQPGTTNIVPGPTSNATEPGATNTTTPVPTGAIQPGADSTANPPALTPQQVYQQLQQIRAQQQQQQSPTTPPPQ